MKRLLPISKFALAVLFVCHAVLGQAPKPGPNPFVMGGQQQEIYFTPARGLPDVPNVRVLLASGQEGWKGHITGLAQTIASWGHDVYGLDTRAYTGNVRVPSPADIAEDVRKLAAWMLAGTGRQGIFVGWGEGARLGVFALAEPETQALFGGLIAINLPGQSAPKLPQVTLPFVMIAAGQNLAGSADQGELFANAREPKRLHVIDSSDRYFSGNRRAFLDALHSGVQWIAEKSK